MTIDRKLILDATKLKLARSATSCEALHDWMNDAMSTLSVNEALVIPNLEGRRVGLLAQNARQRLNKLGGGAKRQFCVRVSQDKNSVYLIRQAGPPTKPASSSLAAAAAGARR